MTNLWTWGGIDSDWVATPEGREFRTCGATTAKRIVDGMNALEDAKETLRKIARTGCRCRVSARDTLARIEQGESAEPTTEEQT